ncbi:MAG: hypothetical protein LBR72_06500 [Oscillospiraceae bacterium]|jgi:hypothetical protein|nr:hypothetical protein [Oscillospiraceae bacterium]
MSDEQETKTGDGDGFDEFEDFDPAEMENIDEFLNTLHIPAELIDDTDVPLKVLRTRPPVTIANIFPLLAWVVFIIAVFTVIQAGPSGGSFFENLLGKASPRHWDSQQLFAGMCYLFGDCAVCAGGLAIRFHLKWRLTSAGTISLLACFVLSAAISLLLLFTGSG